MKISRLQYITTNPQHAEEACKGGASWIQLRVKNIKDADLLVIAKETKKICSAFNAKLIINDHVLIAQEINADGVHLGKTDMSPIEARKILGENFIIGGTANTLEDVVNLNILNIDYIGLGPFRYTSTKQNLSPLIGLNGYIYMFPELKRRNVNVPIIAIGDIRSGDVKNLLSAGVYGIAVSSAITHTKNITESTKEFLKLL